MDYDCYDVYSIGVTAYRSDSEPWRLERLQRVIGYVAAHNELFLPQVKALHDRKGVLTVTWLREPTKLAAFAFEDAWLSVIGDGSDAVEHCAQCDGADG